jgi:hypothetical protein
MALDEQLQPHRTFGLQRFPKGAGKWWAGIKSDTPLGQVISAHDAARKQLRVAVARRKDVGNLSRTEQEAAEQIIADTYFDAAGTAKIKNAYLRQLVAIDENDKTAVRDLLRDFMKSGAYQPTYDKKTQKLQINKSTGEMRVVPR